MLELEGVRSPSDENERDEVEGFLYQQLLGYLLNHGEIQTE